MNPFETATFADAIAQLGERYGDREALVFAGRRYSFADVRRESDRAAARFASLGLPGGAKVAIWMSNRPEFIWYWFGAAQLGLVAVLLNTRLRKDEFAYQIAQSDSAVVVVPGRPGFRDFLADLVDTCPELLSRPAGQLNSPRFPMLHGVIACDPPSQAAPGVVDWSAPSKETLRSLPPTDSNAPSMILYSSGTTALPKGAMLSHCLWQKAHDAGTRLDLGPADCLYLSIPLFGVMGSLGGILTMWSHGARVVLAERFDVDGCINALVAEPCTALHLLPAMIDPLLSHPRYGEVLGLGALRTGVALTNNPVALRRIDRDLRIKGVVTSYGMTELTGPVTRTRWDDPSDIRFETQGAALPGISIRIADPESGRTMPPGEEGEIQVAGYCLMLGYYNKPEETRRSITADGYLKSGDLGVLNADATLKFLRRLKDGYKHKGFNVSTPEVEAVVSKHPDVAAVAVIGIPDQLYGEIGVAFVVPQFGRAPTADQLVEYLRPRLASYKIPSRVFIVDALPVTSGTEKVQKFKLRVLAEKLLATNAVAGN